MIRNDENLLKLGRGLLTLPRHSKRFNMGMFECGTTADACGWGLVFVEPKLAGESWDSYCERVFGVPLESTEWHWLFSATWKRTDNTPWGAAGRIAWLIQHGLPDNWYDQMYGWAPLCYPPRRGQAMTDSPLKIELGKTYLDGLGRKVRIICVDAAGGLPVIGLVAESTGCDFTARYKLDGGHVISGCHSLTREYKEPIVHKRDVVWGRSLATGLISVRITSCGEALPPYGALEVRRQTVEYTEPQEDGQ